MESLSGFESVSCRLCCETLDVLRVCCPSHVFRDVLIVRGALWTLSKSACARRAVTCVATLFVFFSPALSEETPPVSL